MARGQVRDGVSDAAWLRAMLAAEAALARAEARRGVISTTDAEEIAAACEGGSPWDIDALGEAATATGNPVVPLVAELRGRVGGRAADAVHLGATSQDILDTAEMLVVRDALDALLDDLAAAADAAAALAEAHRATLLPGRTLLQHALPTTFGLVAAGWMVGLDRAARRLREVRHEVLAAQLGGAAGTLASLGARGPGVLGAFAAELGLREPEVPWHTERTRLGEVAAALGVAAGAIAKPSLDVVLLAQTEVGEVREGVPGRGGSSTLPQKRNPVAAVTARASAARVPGLVATLLAGMAQEQQRAAGAWHAEWRTLSDLLEATGSAAAWIRDCLEHLEVDAGRMRANLDLTGGAVLAERLESELARALGRSAARALVADAVRDAAGGDGSLAEALRRRLEAGDEAAGTTFDVDALLDPAGYLGSADELVTRALRGRRGENGGGGVLGATDATDRRARGERG